MASALKKHLRSTVFGEKSNYEAFRDINPLVNALLPKAATLVARRGSRALGFVIFEDVDGIALVHVYVREGERREGVAKHLLAAAYEHIDPESTLESFWPSERWAEKATEYGFYVPEAM